MSEHAHGRCKRDVPPLRLSGRAFFLGLIWAVVFFFPWVIDGRVWMETIIVLFRIAENTSALVRAGRGGQPESGEGAKDTLV